VGAILIGLLRARLVVGDRFEQGRMREGRPGHLISDRNAAPAELLRHRRCRRKICLNWVTRSRCTRVVGFDNAHRATAAGSRFKRRSVAADHWHRTENEPGQSCEFKASLVPTWDYGKPAVSTLKAFLRRRPEYHDAEQPLMARIRQVKAADWSSPTEAKKGSSLGQHSEGRASGLQYWRQQIPDRGMDQLSLPNTIHPIRGHTCPI